MVTLDVLLVTKVTVFTDAVLEVEVENNIDCDSEPLHSSEVVEVAERDVVALPSAECVTFETDSL